MKIFISYSRLDSDLGKAVYNYLSDSHEVFIDTKKIAGGEDWSNIIENEISKCDRFVIILTLSSINRSEVKKEIDLALNKKKKIIPCVHNSIDIKKIPLELKKYNGLQFEEGPELGRKLLAMISLEEEENGNNKEKKNNMANNLYEEKQQETKTTGSIQTYLEKAKIFERLKQNQRALNNYEQTLQLEPYNFETLFSKILLPYKMEQFNNALETIERAIDLQPENPEVWYYKGIILDKLGKYEEALDALDTNLLIDNKGIKSLSSKANILLKKEKYDEVLKIYDEILEIEQDNVEAKRSKDEVIEKLKNQELSTSLNVIKSKFRNKNYSNVIDLCDKAIMENNQNDPILYVFKGNSLYELEQYDEAIEYLNKALEIDPHNEEAMISKRKIIQEQSNKKIETETLSKKEIREIKLLKKLKGHSREVSSVAITSDNKKIVSSSWDKTIKVWNIETGELLQTLTDHSDFVFSVAITPDNKKIVSGSGDNTIKVWNIETGELLKTLKGHSFNISSVAITSDNKKIVSGSYDHTIKVWQIIT